MSTGAAVRGNVKRSRTQVRWVTTAIAVLCASAQSDAQLRPAIPEIACTRVSLRVTQGTGSGARAFGLRITNDDRADFPARLQSEIGVEREVGGRWQPVSVAGLSIRSNCHDHPNGCVTLEPRTAIDVVPWTGMLGDGQCICTRCMPAPSGRYRFVVHSCPGCFSPHTFESAPFTL